MQHNFWIALAVCSLAAVLNAQTTDELTTIKNSEQFQLVEAVTLNTSPALLGKSTTGQPYSATKTILRERTLADGTHVTSKIELQLYRDFEGRVRAEGVSHGSRALDEQHIANIVDPVNHTHIHLFAIGKLKTATIRDTIEFPQLKPAGVSDTKANALVSALAVAPPPPPPPPPTAQLSGVVRAPRSLSTNPCLKPRVEEVSLPMETVAGVQADGKRTTKTIAVGCVGNDREIQIVTETWTSPELHLVLKQVVDDPRTGKETEELSNLQRNVPDPALFTIPEGYKVSDNRKQKQDSEANR